MGDQDPCPSVARRAICTGLEPARTTVTRWGSAAELTDQDHAVVSDDDTTKRQDHAVPALFTANLRSYPYGGSNPVRQIESLTCYRLHHRDTNTI